MNVLSSYILRIKFLSYFIYSYTVCLFFCLNFSLPVSENIGYLPPTRKSVIANNSVSNEGVNTTHTRRLYIVANLDQAQTRPQRTYSQQPLIRLPDNSNIR